VIECGKEEPSELEKLIERIIFVHEVPLSAQSLVRNHWIEIALNHGTQQTIKIASSNIKYKLASDSFNLK